MGAGAMLAHGVSSEDAPAIAFPPKLAVDRLVHRGAHSTIYRAHHRVIDQPVALKVLDPAPQTDPPELDPRWRAFIRMGSTMIQLASQHAAIIQTRDCDLVEHDGGVLPYLVCEWFEGRTLDRVLDDPAPGTLRAHPPEDAIHLFEGVLEALALAHDAGIVHADLRPGNLLVHDGALRLGGPIKLLDFSQHHRFKTGRDGAQTESPDDAPMVSPSYGAPEQIRGDRSMVGPWTDVYSMALILVEVMLGHPPLEGKTEAEVTQAAIDPVRRPTPRTLGLELSDELEQAFARALAVPTHARFRTMIEFRRALMEATSATKGARGRDPRATMAVSERDGSGQGDGVAGSFAIAAAADVVRELRRPSNARVRLAQTMVAPPSAPTVAPSVPRESPGAMTKTTLGLLMLVGALLGVILLLLLLPR